MKYKVKRMSDGMVGWREFATVREAKAEAKYASQFHGRIIVVDARTELPLPTARRLTASEKAQREAGQQMWRTINFTCNAGR